MIVVIDNFDSFTYNLVDYFVQNGVKVKVVRNDITPADLKKISFEGIVLSPGPGSPEKAGNLFTIIEENIGRKPILGVCLGHQALGMVLGAELRHASRPMHGKVSKINHSGHPLFNSVDSPFPAVRYHSLILKNIPKELNTVAWIEDENMGFCSNELKVSGIQFHPESVLTPDGMKILKNWLSLHTIKIDNSVVNT